MCGICGISWKDARLLRRMRERVSHRGPDGEGAFADARVSLGHCRLAIIGLSEKGKQPMAYGRKGRRLVITFNGEIFNYAALRDELAAKGHRFTTGTDTEVILAGYAEWGPEVLGRLDGMFAFCIYDAAKGDLFLARDRFGIKPLYYATTEEGLSFSSEIGGLAGLAVRPEIDTEGLRQFFTFRFTLGATTLLRGIRKLLPGHWLLYDTKGKKVRAYRRYYALAPARIRGKRGAAWYRQELRRRMEEAVTRWMVADVPVASLLSGGIDSSVIALLAKRRNPRLNTFAMGFDTTNELAEAKRVARSIGSAHHELRLHEGNVLKHLDAMVAHMDEPIGDPGFLPVLVLSEAVKRRNKVVLSGDGGDEVLTGYDRYKLLRYGLALRHLAFAGLGSDVLARLKAMRGRDEYGAFLEIVRLFGREELAALGVEEYDARPLWDEATRGFPTATERAQAFDIATLLPGDFFMKADKMSSAYGLEQRTPFLDHELVEFCFAIPLRHKLRLWDEKHVLKRAFRGELPEETTRRRKQGFNVPIDHWFKGALGDRLRELVDRSAHGLYRKEPVYRLLDRMRGRKSGGRGGSYKENFLLAQKLWSVLVFELWYEKTFGKL